MQRHTRLFAALAAMLGGMTLAHADVTVRIDLADASGGTQHRQRHTC